MAQNPPSADFKKKPEVEAGVSMLIVYNSLQWKRSKDFFNVLYLIGPTEP